MKIVRDGKTAVAVSKGFGAGWSTWNSVNPMDMRFNVLFLEGKWEEAEKLCKELKLGYGGGAEDVRIEWVEKGREFIIEEYDGKESIKFKDETIWRMA